MQAFESPQIGRDHTPLSVSNAGDADSLSWVDDSDVVLGDPVETEVADTEPGQPLTDGYAVGCLASAIAGLVIPIVPSVAALYLSAASEERIKAAPDRLTGARLNAAGRILAWLGMSLWVLGTLFFIAGVAGRVVSG